MPIYSIQKCRELYCCFSLHLNENLLISVGLSHDYDSYCSTLYESFSLSNMCAAIWFTAAGWESVVPTVARQNTYIERQNMVDAVYELSNDSNSIMVQFQPSI